MEELCFNVGTSIATIATGVVTVASVLANVLPNPGEKTGAVKALIKAVNWLGVNFKVNTEEKKDA